MAAIRDPTSADIAHFLATRTGLQMVRVVQGLREPAAQAAFTAELMRNPLPTPNPSRVFIPEKGKKPLNAFVGFRCYYMSIPAFKTWPMKKMSHFMAILWDNDPNKPLWSLMTKAWSIIRDQIGKDSAPLYEFFSIICPYLNIPSPETYLELYGWSIFIDEAGEPTLFHDQISEPMSTEVAGVQLSAEDIISYCQTWGYAPTFVADLAAMAQKIRARTDARKKRHAKRMTSASKVIPDMIKRDIAIAHEIPSVGLPDGTEDEFDFLDAPQPCFDNLARRLRNYLARRQNDPITITHEMIMEADAEYEEVAAWNDFESFNDNADDTTPPSCMP